LGRLRVAESLPDVEEEVLAQLLAHAQRRPEPLLSCLNFEFIELQRVADRSRQATGQIATGQRGRTFGPGELLPFAKLVDRGVEHNQRQDVGLIERRVAAERQLRLLYRPLDAD